MDNGARRTSHRLLSVGFFVLLFTLTSASAQPPLFEPQEGYYKAKGTRVSATWSVDRDKLAEDEVLLATLTVRGATNPQEIVRPDLRKLKDFTDQFRTIEHVGDGGDAVGVSFTYRLRPRDRDTKRLPSLDFFFLKPGGGDKPFENARAKGINLTVTAAAPKPVAKLPPVPMTEPDALFEIAAGPDVLGRGPFVPGAWAWLAMAAFGPLAAWGGFVAWRRVYPDSARQALIRRSRAARRALETIAAAHKRPDTAAAITNAVLHYLRHRFPLPAGADTPSELEAGLRAADVPAVDAAVTAEFFRMCDEARFAPESDIAMSLRGAASSIIARMEAVV
jgi:hypothetical protein